MWALSLENPAQPQVIGTYGPESFELVFEGQGVFPSTPFVWAAEVQDDLIYISDFNSGLYILRLVDQNSTNAGSSVAGNGMGLVNMLLSFDLQAMLTNPIVYLLVAMMLFSLFW